MKRISTLFLAALCCANMLADGINDYTKTADLRYVDDDKVYHQLDIYYPADDGQTKHPVIVHVYGSAWTGNNMKGYADLSTVGLAALQAGYIFVAPNHRASTDAKFPAQIHDIKAVIRYLRGNAESLGIDTSFIAISGFSSGGHLAALMATTTNLKNAAVDMEGTVGLFLAESSAVHAACTWSGIVELRNIDGCNPVENCSNYAEDLIGTSYESNPIKWSIASANTYVDAGDVPTIIFHGSADPIVPTCTSENFYNKLHAAGVDTEYVLHSGQHTVDAGSLDKMITFFNRIRSTRLAIDSPSLQGRSGEASKLLRDGQLLIQQNGQIVNVLGQPIR